MKKIFIICAVIWCVLLGVGTFWYVKSHDVTSEIESSDSLFYKELEKDMIETNLETGEKYVRNELLLEAQDNVTREEVEYLVEELGGEIVGYIEAASTYQIAFEEDITYDFLTDIREKLEKEEKVFNVALNYVLEVDEQAEAFYPNDEKWENEWDKEPKGGNWGFEMVQAPEAWKLLGKNENTVSVGVFELNSVDKKHKDLSMNIKSCPGRRSEKLEHATEVAGVIGAGHNNEIGITGVMPKVDLHIIYHQYFSDNDRNYSTLMAYKMGLTYLIVQQKCKVVNISLGDNEMQFAASRGVQNARDVLEAESESMGSFLKNLLTQGYEFVICKSAGNLNGSQIKFVKADEGDKNAPYGYIEEDDENKERLKKYRKRKDYASRLDCGNVDAQYDMFAGITEPEVRDRILVVGSIAMNQAGYYVAEHSNCGGRVDIIAPGQDLMALEPKNSYSGEGNYCSGTSFAAPFVAGTAGLIFTEDEELKGSEVKHIIVDSAVQECVGFLEEKNYSYKVLNTFEAVKMAKGIVEPEEKIELIQYIGENIFDVADQFEGMRDSEISDGGIGYENDNIAFEARDTAVSFVQIRRASPYTIAGVSYGMQSKEAIKELEDRGYTLTQTSETYWMFLDEGGNQISLYASDPEHIDMVSYSQREEVVPEESVKENMDIYQMLAEHYAGEGTLMEGYTEGDFYLTSVRTGVPGNPTASQMLYDIEVDLSSGIVTEWNPILNETKTWQLF